MPKPITKKVKFFTSKKLKFLNDNGKIYTDFGGWTFRENNPFINN